MAVHHAAPGAAGHCPLLLSRARLAASTPMEGASEPSFYVMIDETISEPLAPSPGPIIEEINSVDDISGDDDQSFRPVEEINSGDAINGDEEEGWTIVD